ncbi:MAG: Crp/Fnr family transcriptional regulator [Deltaproteobacteria bacterium]|jgi:CRP-like cAMP-binding protein|nr:Crp/Fnr family transcriptional regulator [Deltaproteobacteria bacterium]
MIIKEIELFKGIDHEIMNEIANICSEKSYVKGTVIFEKDEEAKCLYILVEGTVKLKIKNGGTITYSLTNLGDIFGWSCIVESGRYTASSVCATDLKALEIERGALDKIFNLHPHMGIKVLKRLAGVFSNRISNAYKDLLSARTAETSPSYG